MQPNMYIHLLLFLQIMTSSGGGGGGMCVVRVFGTHSTVACTELTQETQLLVTAEVTF